ncbi:hypothetical protein [Mesoflavibacter sp.]|uniref:hypothetical protein n=2 Tax=Mesoflavibacter sp. TaxID=1930902 RepID=UPI00355A3E31
MNWYRQTLYWISIVSISYFAYTEIIYKKENILPDFETISNELWIIILIFIFHTLNQIRISSDNTIKRKENYLRNRLNHFRSKYSTLVNEKIENDKLKQIAYAIMIYEDFNRPKVARFIENLKFKVTGKKHSLGLMQVQTKKFINDYKSVELGLKKLNKSYKKALKKVLKEREMEEGEEHQKQFYRDQIAYMNEITIQNEIISKYNGGHSYNNEVSRLVELISEKKLIKIQSYLYPNYSGRRITYPYGEAEYEEE